MLTTDGSCRTSKPESGNYIIDILDKQRNGEEQYLSSFINIKVLGDTDISNQDSVTSATMLSGQVRIVLKWGVYPSNRIPIYRVP